MTRGKLKTTLRRKRITRNIVAVTAAVISCTLVIVLGVLLVNHRTTPNTVSNNNESTTSDGLTSGITSVLYDMDIEELKVKSTRPEMVQSNNKETATEERITVKDVKPTIKEKRSDNLIKEGTILYASHNLNVREKPTKESGSIGAIIKGNKLEVKKDIGNGWVQIEHNNTKAYVCSDFLTDESPMILVSSTAYYDEFNRTSASSRKLVEGHSIAGKVSWLNKSVNVYRCNSDGTVGEFLGTYTFDDTGYGAESGVGSSKILKGRSIGTIENGTCIDFYFDTRSECISYGRRDVYIQFI